MIGKMIDWCMNNRMLVIMLTVVLAAAGLWAAMNINIDAIPDLSDVQVVIRTEYPGQAPQIVEDQVTYPLTTAMLAVPNTKTVRGQSMFGTSFVYVIFKDGTNLYWARSRVLEQLATVSGELPPTAKPQLGPDATSVGWVYQYALVTGPYSPKHPKGLWHDVVKNKWYARRADAPQAVRDRLKRVRIFPGRKVSPLDGKTKLVQPKINLADLRSIQDWQLRYDLTTVQGVSEVASIGGYVKQYQVTLDPVKLRAFHISLQKVDRAIRQSNQDAGGRLLDLGETEYMVRSRGYLGTPDHPGAGKPGAEPLATDSARSKRIERQLREISLGATKAGVPITLSDVAHVTIGPQIRRGILDWDNRGQAVGGIVIMRFGGNARNTIDRVKVKLAELSNSLPPGVAFRTGYDRSDLIDRAVGTLHHTLIEEIIIVSLICVIFLFHVRSALVAALVLPVGVLVTLGIMYLLGISANIMSLGGIAISIGVMVDSSIVTVENAHKHLEHEKHRIAAGHPPRSRLRIIADAAIEVGPSLFFALLIIAVSFVPIFVLNGQSGRMFAPLAYTGTFAMLSAAVLAVTIIPVLMLYFIGERIVPATWRRPARLLVYLLAIATPAVALALVPLGSWTASRWWLVGTWVVLSSVIVLPQKIWPEQRNPLNLLLATVYEPAFALVMKFWPITLAVAIALITISIYPLSHLGSEFMPPLNEGDLLYMPSTIEPGVSITEAGSLLQQTNKLIMKFPEVKSVWAKVGRADTATDPAPLNMIESTITLKRDKSQWRQRRVDRFYDNWPGWAKWLPEKIWPRTRPVTMHELIYGYPGPDGVHVPGLNQALSIPGIANAWTMPIKTRIDMLSTGIKTPIGIKVMGPNLTTLSKLGTEISESLKSDPRTASFTRSAYGDKTMGGKYVNIYPNRDAIARYGLTVGAVQSTIASALGGMNITDTVEGLGRFSVNVRYPRELRDNLAKLKQTLIATPAGREIPLGQLATVAIQPGPPVIKTEDAQPSTWIYVDIDKIDIGSYVNRAKAVIADHVKFPPGYSIVWSGQYQYMQEARQRLMVAVPMTAVLIVLLLFLGTRSWLQVAIVLLSEPFALAGAVWFTYLMGYNLSLAVSVGMIALAGVAAETGIVMLLYMDNSYQQFKADDRLHTTADLWQAIHDGAVKRIRPMTMTVAAIFMGLVPLLWAHGAGADTMRRLAVPMIGGVSTAFVLELLIYPVVFYLAKAPTVWPVPKESRDEPTSQVAPA